MTELFKECGNCGAEIPKDANFKEYMLHFSSECLEELDLRKEAEEEADRENRMFAKYDLGTVGNYQEGLAD